MPKLTKKEYIVKAAKLYGLEKVEIDALKKHLDGEQINGFIERRCKPLYSLYDLYSSKDYYEHIKLEEDGCINLNDYHFEKTNRRLSHSKIGQFWLLSSNLDDYLVTEAPNKNSAIPNKFIGISRKNNFLLPQLAKQMDLDATVYYKGKYTNSDGTISTHHLTKNFLCDEETLIQGNSIVKDTPNKRKVHLETLLEETDRYIRKHYKKYELPEEDLERTRTEVRQGLIKQTVFNKIVFNENESNEKWGLIRQADDRLRLAPIFSYDYCAGAEPISKAHHRTVRGKEDIETIMLEYGKEVWFRRWIENYVLKIDLNSMVKQMQKETGVTLDDEEKEYYQFLISKMKAKVSSVCDLNYDKELVQNMKQEKLGNKILRAIDTISDKFIGIRNFARSLKNEDSDAR